MGKWVFLACMLVGLTVLIGGPAMADNGPHMGDFNPTTDACAGCHRVHRGQAENLLIANSQTALCFSCHGNAATGADTNVEDGVYLERDGVAEGEGIDSEGLRGGGFVNALMRTDPTLPAASGAVTSKHNVDEVGTIWGAGAAGSGPGTGGVTLRCASCHNPHGISGSDTYRVLRPIPRDAGAATGVVVADDATKDYNISYNPVSGAPEDDGYRDYGYKNLGSWCSQCHTRYLAASANEFAGEDIFKHRHVTTGSYRQCLACHVAHGTSATMGAYSGAVELPDGTAGAGSTDSRLLHVNNRGVCYQCHPAPGND